MEASAPRVIGIVVVAAACSCSRGHRRADDRPVAPAPVELTGADITTDPVDRALKDEIRHRLDDAALGDIAVEVSGGVVTLRGGVTAQVHDDALRIAREATPDDRRVEDALVINSIELPR